MLENEIAPGEVMNKLAVVEYYIGRLHEHFIESQTYIGPHEEMMYPNVIVDEIAMILGDEIVASGNLHVLKLSSYTNYPFKPRVFADRRNVYIYSHAAALYQGRVYDPLVGRPIDMEEYLHVAFENPARLFRRQIVPYERRS